MEKGVQTAVIATITLHTYFPTYMFGILVPSSPVNGRDLLMQALTRYLAEVGAKDAAHAFRVVHFPGPPRVAVPDAHHPVVAPRHELAPCRAEPNAQHRAHVVLRTAEKEERGNNHNKRTEWVYV